MLGPFGLQFIEYRVFVPKLELAHWPYLSELNFNEMDLERHSQYCRSEQIFLLTLECTGRLSFLPKIGALTVLLVSVLVAGSVTGAAQPAPPKNSVGNQMDISIGLTDCRALVRHTDTNSVPYKPGVDVNNSSVAGANVSDTGVDCARGDYFYAPAPSR